jgi:HK97 family phage major capsid protein
MPVDPRPGQGRRPGAHDAEHAAVEADMARVRELDQQIEGRDLVKSVMALGAQSGPWPNGDGTDDRLQYLSLRTPGLKSGLTARFGAAVASPGVKALLHSPDEPFTSIPMSPEIVRLGEAPTSLIEVLPAITRPVVYRYLRQTTRTNNAAPVAPGALKPTSSYGLTSVDGRLHVIAHLSEPMDKFVLQDGLSLADFVRLEMVSGIHDAVKAQLVSGDGTGESLTGLANTNGIQTQAFATSPVLTARAAITKVEVLGFQPYYFVLHPTDWEKVETATLDAGQYVLNADGQRNGVPVDSAARRLWGVPVIVTTAMPAGTGYLLSNGVAQLVTDGALQAEQSSAYADDFGRNQVRLRVEGRFDLAVTRPMGVVKMSLTA